jgi:hypothetical protein
MQTMKALHILRCQNTERGFVSVIVILFMLSNSLTMSGSKSLESQQQYDSVAALALAESGLEASLASLSKAANFNESTFPTTCSNFKGTNNTPINLGRNNGYFQYVPSKTVPTSQLCPVRVLGSVNNAKRTLEAQVNFAWQIGTGGYGGQTQNPPTMTLKNPYDVAAAAVFNLAWRIKDSLGHPEATGNQATAAPCSGCVARWNLPSSAGSNAVGSLGSTYTLAKSSEVSVSQTLSLDRNYVEVGLILGGYGATAPVYTGSYSDKQETANTANSLVTYGNIPSKGNDTTLSPPLMNSSNWCYQADTMVFGLSGRGPDTYDYSAKLAAVDFNSSGSPAQQVPLTYIAHYPTDSSSPGTTGDVYTDIWYVYNQFAYMTGANAGVGATTISVNESVSLKKDTYLKVYSGTGELQGFTQVKNDIVNSNSIPITKPVLAGKALSDANVCAGICALFDNPSSANASTKLKVTRSTAAAAAAQYAGGLACFKGVDPTKIKAVTSSGTLNYLWHEVSANE